MNTCANLSFILAALFKSAIIISLISLPTTNKFLSLSEVNEEGTEINCKASVGSHLSFRYNASFCSIDNSKLDDSSYKIIFYINGIVSFDLNESYGDYDGLVGAIYRNDKIYKSRTFSNVHLKDDEGLCTKAELSIPIRPQGYEYSSIVIKYSESKCRELSK